MNKLEKIKEVIIKANPSIMELKFGCEVLLDDKEKCTIGFWNPVYSGWSSDIGDEIEKEEIKQILGRPIQLADVLMAIEKKCKNELYHIGTDGVIGVPLPINPMTTFVECVWDLSKNLDNQKPEVIDLLFELLVKDK